MNPLAESLNIDINKSNKTIFNLLSNMGKELFFPKGILSQSAEAKEKATKFNATVGIATDGTSPLVMPSFEKYFNDLKKPEIFSYSPSYGNASLRKTWQKRIQDLNPSLNSTPISMPVVTQGITSGLSLVADVFFDKDDVIILPNQIWGNYKLSFEVRRQAKHVYYDFFENGKFNINAFETCVKEQAKTSDKLIILLNFPNNPTGYSPTNEDVDAIIKVIAEQANNNKQILTISDDAYFGLFFEENVFTESVFSKLAGLHENVLAIKLDGITKEYFAWGLRVGFITYGCKNTAPEAYLALEKKTAGALRGNISNCSSSAQSIALKVLDDPNAQKEAEKNATILKQRALKIKEILKDPKYSSQFIAYPFNSGYFMLLKLKNVEAEKTRLHLLDAYGVGTISTAKNDLRVAFSCVKVEDLQELFDIIFKACEDLN